MSDRWECEHCGWKGAAAQVNPLSDSDWEQLEFQPGDVVMGQCPSCSYVIAPTGEERWEKLHPETVWPTAEAAGDIEWKLRYAPGEMDRSDQLVAASVCAAYRYLRENPGADWKQKVKALEMKLRDK